MAIFNGGDEAISVQQHIRIVPGSGDAMDTDFAREHIVMP